MPDVLAGKYAEALYLTTGHNRVLQERASFELEAMVELAREYPGLIDYFDSRAIDRDMEELFLERLIDGLGFSEEIHGFLRAVIKRNRFYHLRDIYLAFREMLERANPRDEAFVVTPRPLDDEERFRLRLQLEKILKKHVEIRERIDPSLLAGIRVEAGHRTYDASLDHRLGLLREQLLKREDLLAS